MVEFEADDALATAASRFRDQPGVEQVVICSPDKDLAQAVSGARVVCWDRRRDSVLDEDGVVVKFGVRPHSIPDWLALVGDAADGYPGVPAWGAKSAAAVLSRFEHLEAIPEDPGAARSSSRACGPPRGEPGAPTARRHFSTGAWRRSATTSRSRRASPISSGEARGRSSRRSAGSWARGRSPSASRDAATPELEAARALTQRADHLDAAAEEDGDNP